MQPSPNGRNGRGQFAKGNPGGPGNPLARRTAQLRSALLRYVKPKHMRAVVKALYEQAIGGDLAAIREFLDRTIGRAVPMTEATDPAVNPREAMFTDPAVIDFGYQRWLVDQIQRFGKLPRGMAEGTYDPNYAEYCTELALREDLLPPPVGERIEVIYHDDWYGSTAANRAATKAIGSS